MRSYEKIFIYYNMVSIQLFKFSKDMANLQTRCWAKEIYWLYYS